MIRFIEEFTFCDPAVKEAYDTIKREQKITQNIWGKENMGRMSDLHIMKEEQEPCFVVGDDKGVWIKDSQGHVINMHPFASMAEARRFCLGLGLNLQAQPSKGENMPEQKPAPRFLIEIKLKKEVVYKVTLPMTKELAQEWGEKWIQVNHRSDDHKVVVTEVHVQPQANEAEAKKPAKAKK